MALGLSCLTVDILAFMEYLLHAGMSASDISNHLTSMCVIYDCDIFAFRDNRIPLLIKAVKLIRPLLPKLTFLIDQILLYAIVKASATLQFPATFKAL